MPKTQLMKIILGSESKGRKRVLTEMGYEFEVMPANIDKKAIRADSPSALTLALALAKARALIEKIDEPALLITADKVVTHQGIIKEKPTSPEEVRATFKDYVFFPAVTISSVVVTNTQTKRAVSATDRAMIWFKPIPDDVVKAYIATGDPFKHAGSFDHEHPLIRDYVRRREGERESIIGLPKALTQLLIEDAISDTA